MDPTVQAYIDLGIVPRLDHEVKYKKLLNFLEEADELGLNEISTRPEDLGDSRSEMIVNMYLIANAGLSLKILMPEGI